MAEAVTASRVGCTRTENPTPGTSGSLSAERRRTLAAASARILPSDDGPGAAETGVVDYIDGALRDRWHRHFVPLMERGLDFLEALARESHGTDFGACTPEQQDAVLHRAQRFPNNDARRFFQRLVELTLEGFLCDPVHGGNGDRLGWRFLGFELDQPAPCDGAGR